MKNKPLKIIVIGARGRTGQFIVNKIIKNNNFQLINTSRKNIKNNNIGYKLIGECDVIIDFSVPKSTLKILNFARKLKKKIVIGTTGFTNKQNKLIKNHSKRIAIFKSGNMSMGINLLEYIVNILSKKIPNNYYIGIFDDHHKKKIDYPSGTALMLANAVSKGKNKNLESIKGKFFLNKKDDLQKNKINFFITRKGNTIGKHSVLFKNKTESIELKHTAFSRELFAEGALNAAIWISKKNKGLFNMQDMFNLK
jgi:4-hydroxy-tetrahydrodipicolinate reductase